MDHQDYQFSGSWLRARRKQLGMTQHELAEASGVGQTAVSQWEHGKVVPSWKHLLNLARALGCTPLHLMGQDTADLDPVTALPAVD